MLRPRKNILTPRANQVHLFIVAAIADTRQSARRAWTSNARGSIQPSCDFSAGAADLVLACAARLPSRRNENRFGAPAIAPW
jgi:hypothetical protein